AKLKKEIIEPILPLAHLTRQKQAMFTGGAAYARDQLPKEIQDKITYPRLREMGGEILKLQDKKPGENVVLHDQPELTYYVTVLVKQTEPAREEFFQAYRGAAPDVGIAELFE